MANEIEIKKKSRKALRTSFTKTANELEALFSVDKLDRESIEVAWELLLSKYDDLKIVDNEIYELLLESATEAELETDVEGRDTYFKRFTGLKVKYNSCIYLVFILLVMENLEREVPVRSLHSRNKICIRMVNLANRDVDIVWINFIGQYVKYGRLSNQSYIDVNTFETHPWIAVDSQRKDRLLLDKQFVYTPRSWRENFQNLHPDVPIESIPEHINLRILVKITVPVYSLRYRTLLEVRSCLKSTGDAESLDLPKEIVDDLKLVMQERSRYPWKN
ncbi:hypothetical protein RN001_001207 [Aquatica leii]|uniref:von Hippel-Lindau disease tumour suppressor beta domain-containing protein n=1 Tax=Aquatica leii TaxID=1421715 RepID=A0AAN7PKZ8_9COLE|nr:hypothetical protein RN001_001207 [Aquatica leii]